MPSIATTALGVLSYILLAGGILLQLFVILSGYVVNYRPMNRIYFLQADTEGIDGAINPARWTFLAICGSVDGRNGNCGSTQAALPFDPPRNFGTENGVPDAFIGTNYFYYMSRFAFAFFLIALFFSALTLITGLMTFCKFRFAAFLASGPVFLAFFFQALATVLMTVWSVKGRNRFRNNDQPANIGQYGYGFTWAPTVCFFLCAIMNLVGALPGRSTSVKRSASTRSNGGFNHNLPSAQQNASESSFKRMEAGERV